MRLLFSMDSKDYDGCKTVFARHSARCIAIQNGKVAMVHSRKYNYYKFPGGGIEKGEAAPDAMVRETAEEAGLTVMADSIREFGYVHRIQKSTYNKLECFIQDNFYYLCQVEQGNGKQCLDDYEAEAGFTLKWVIPEKAIECNRTADHADTDQTMLEREVLVLERLIEERYFEGSFV